MENRRRCRRRNVNATGNHAGDSPLKPAHSFTNMRPAMRGLPHAGYEALEAVCAWLSSGTARATGDQPGRTIPPALGLGGDANRRSDSQWSKLVFGIRHTWSNSGDDGFLLKSKSGVLYDPASRLPKKERERGTCANPTTTHGSQGTFGAAAAAAARLCCLNLSYVRPIFHPRVSVELGLWLRGN